MSGVGSHERIRTELIARVRKRRVELEEAIFARVREAPYEQTGSEDAEYVAGLRAAIVATVAHGLAEIERHGESPGSAIPHEAVAQAHRAARTGVSLDTVLRRYVLGSTLLGDFLVQEAERGDLADQRGVLRAALGAQAAVLDSLIAAITCEYMRELERVGRSPEQRRCERVLRLLEGEAPGDAAELGYDIEEWHLGTIATGAAATRVLRCAAETLDSRLLCVSRGEETVWGWFGARRRLAVEDLLRALSKSGAREVSLAIGEPGRGVEGWRLTHRQAQAALRVALHRPRPLVRYADVALVAAALRDDVLAGSLTDIYLTPLGDNRNGGAALRQTLRAYFAADRNASSAASALGVARHTVENRLRSVEQKLGCALRAHQAELEVALHLEELGEGPCGDRAPVLG
jgi:PucR C-terminal helix-turn-helix domain/GGDEF-like domain